MLRREPRGVTPRAGTKTHVLQTPPIPKASAPPRGCTTSAQAGRGIDRVSFEMVSKCAGRVVKLASRPRLSEQRLSNLPTAVGMQACGGITVPPGWLWQGPHTMCSTMQAAAIQKAQRLMPAADMCAGGAQRARGTWWRPLKNRQNACALCRLSVGSNPPRRSPPDPAAPSCINAHVVVLCEPVPAGCADGCGRAGASACGKSAWCACVADLPVHNALHLLPDGYSLLQNLAPISASRKGRRGRCHRGLLLPLTAIAISGLLLPSPGTNRRRSSRPAGPPSAC